MPQAKAKLLVLILLSAFAFGAVSAGFAQEANPAATPNDQSTQTTTDQLTQDNQNSEPSAATQQDQTAGTAEAGARNAAEVQLPSFSYRDTKETSFGRSLVLSIGIFPFAYFYTGFVVDLSRFAAHNFSTSYAPWPFKTQYSVALTDSEMWIKLGIASVTSIVFGFLGTIIK